MRDWIDIGCTPTMEDCAQVGGDDYYERASKECRAYIGLLRRTLGPAPPGARLAVRHNPHDFGTYLSVVCTFETQDQSAIDYAFRCDSSVPEFWDEQARREIGISAKGGSDD